ncbi:DUF721 domain-containing protein [Rhodocista pekingensis]|uniref:DUF721 domain-containing protein n=1 Tax=Rhodocista pekingensis TaxID=201185 RepID=A0ABW2KYG4_9PROT
MSGPQRIGRQVATIAGKALGKNGLAFGGLLTEWATIVGPRLADQTTPLKLTFPKGRRDEAVLHLRVSSPVALLLQHEEPQVLERINAFFGWRAVVRLKLVHGGPALKPAAPARPLRRLSAEEEKDIAGRTAEVPDPDLRDALERLGRAVHGSAPR